MLSFSALLLLVAIGALGLYLALPRGLESETRAVRLTGAGLGGVSVLFLALAGGPAVPGWEASRLASPAARLLFGGLVMTLLVSGGTAVAARGAPASFAALGVLVAAGGAMAAFARSTWMAAAAFVLAAVIGGAAIIRLRRGRAGQTPSLVDDHDAPPMRLETAREPLLACAAGALLASGLVGAVHAAVTVELPRTIAVESNARPPSQRYRAFPRLSVIDQFTGAAAAAGPDADEGRPSRSVRGDFPVLYCVLAAAGLLFAVGTVGLLTRRRIWAVGISALVALNAVALLAAAFAALPVESTRTHAALLPVAVLAVEGGLLAGAAFVLRDGPAGSSRVATDPARPAGFESGE
ncbi:MAG TPA: hypothetical protein VML55_02790 [Planctomycetaceae bacterium]|nr:hypothetical protein [Planctomycetaceae bacterium]